MVPLRNRRQHMTGCSFEEFWGSFSPSKPYNRFRYQQGYQPWHMLPQIGLRFSGPAGITVYSHGLLAFVASCPPAPSVYFSRLQFRCALHLRCAVRPETKSAHTLNYLQFSMLWLITREISFVRSLRSREWFGPKAFDATTFIVLHTEARSCRKLQTR